MDARLGTCIAFTALMALTLSGCLGEPASGPSNSRTGETETTPREPREPPTTASDSPGETNQTEAWRSLASFAACDPRFGCFEPSAAPTTDGKLLATTMFDGAPLVRFDPSNGAIEQLQPIPLPDGVLDDGSIANSTGAGVADGLLQVAPSGAIYYTALRGQFAAAALYGANFIQVARSDDGGETWPLNRVISIAGIEGAATSADRQFLAFGANGEVYLSFTILGSVTRISRSDDDGASWGPFMVVDGSHGRPGAGPAGPGAVGPDGTLCLPRTLVNDGVRPAELVAYCSIDGGKTFAGNVVATTFAFLPSAAWFQEELFVAWTFGGNAFVAISPDAGQTWGDPIRIAEDVQPVPLWLASTTNHIYAHGYLGDSVTPFVWMSNRSEATLHVWDRAFRETGPDWANTHVVASDFSFMTIVAQQPWIAFADGQLAELGVASPPMGSDA